MSLESVLSGFFRSPQRCAITMILSFPGQKNLIVCSYPLKLLYAMNFEYIVVDVIIDNI